jgi:hypothetical protein
MKNQIQIKGLLLKSLKNAFLTLKYLAPTILFSFMIYSMKLKQMDDFCAGTIYFLGILLTIPVLLSFKEATYDWPSYSSKDLIDKKILPLLYSAFLIGFPSFIQAINH